MANPFGSLPGVVIGVGVGTAASAAIAPVVEPAKQQAWKANPNRILDAARMAALVAQGAVELEAGESIALLDGFDSDKFRSMVYLAQRTPTYGEAQDLRRRNKITADQLRHSFAKAQIEAQYWDALTDLVDDRLSPEVVALAIVRGLMDNPGILPVGPPSAVGKIPAFPVSGIDPVDESASSGFNKQRLAVLAGIAGRPMGPEAAASAVFRTILERVDYDRAIAEGDVRNEWADAIFETARQIPSVADYVNAHIRGWISVAEMNAGTARHGMSPEDTNLLYLRTGRPAAPGQMATAAARGIDGPDGVPMNRAQFLKGIAESDIRPEWGPMLWESRYLYPPLFQLTRLVQAGAIDAATAKDWATKDRYPPEVVDALHTYWLTLSGGAAATVPEVGKARTQLWTAIHRSFIAGEITTDRADNELAALIPDPGDRQQVVTLWEQEKAVTIKQLTPSQIKKAYGANELTQDAAVVRLEMQNWTQADALTFLTT